MSMNLTQLNDIELYTLHNGIDFTLRRAESVKLSKISWLDVCSHHSIRNVPDLLLEQTIRMVKQQKVIIDSVEMQVLRIEKRAQQTYIECNAGARSLHRTIKIRKAYV